MGKLADRVWRITVGTLQVSAPMRVSFEIERDLRPSPNKATVKLWNLTRDHQSQIEQAARAQVIVEAGYEQDRGLRQLFRGELFRGRGGAGVGTAGEGAVNAVTTVEARDGGVEFQQARVSQGFEPDVDVATVVRACARAMGVGLGNVDEVLASAELEAGGNTFPEGTVLSGQASRELSRVLEALGLTWSIQHGLLQLLSRGQGLDRQAVRLAPETGLVGSPEVGTRGRVKVTALLSADIWPGRPVVLDSDRVSGRYLARAATYSGDSHGQPWYARCDLAPEGTTS